MTASDIQMPSPGDKALELPGILIRLLKSVIYRENDERLWQRLLKLQARVREQAAFLDLELVLDESEGYAFFRSRNSEEAFDDDASTENGDSPQSETPRLMARRPLSFPVSLILALLRRKLAEFDQRCGDTRLILHRDDIVELVRVFFPGGTNEIKFVTQIDSHLNKIVELGFLRKLKATHAGDNSFEVKRILKAFVDAQWLANFDAMLEEYKKHVLNLYGVAGNE